MIDKIIYGVAYYNEYMPEERLEKDFAMMKKAGFNTIRIAESTWSSMEPLEGVFDFSNLIRVLDLSKKQDINVIIGTPTYAIPPWMARSHPAIIAKTEEGQGKYGHRQNMDITNDKYLYYSERIIRKLMECVMPYTNVIGFQLDNETKHYHVAGDHVQEEFVEYLKGKFKTTQNMNQEFGLAYWSNAVNKWDDMPDVTGTINGSLFAEFEKFRRNLVTKFLCWQSEIVKEYKREDQFITHNFDFEWREYSYGVQPDVNHFNAQEAVTIAGCDIYHPTQDHLTGKETAFCGAITRSLKEQNYLVLETQAQGHINWTPYVGQLRLQAYAHLANGADGVMYWHWHSIHNSFETYWRGVLSHDLEENRIYREAHLIAKELEQVGDRIIHLKKKNKIALLVSNESLTALSKSPMFPLPDPQVKYNDIVRHYADALYDLNIEYDIVSENFQEFSKYTILVVPALYSASEALLKSIKKYVEDGGNLVMTYKSAYSNEHLKVYHHKKPYILNQCLGISYQEYTFPSKVKLTETEKFKQNCELFIRGHENGHQNRENNLEVTVWMELLNLDGACALANYDHPNWNEYAAVTENVYKKGHSYYVACQTSAEFTKKLLLYVLMKVGLEDLIVDEEFPISIKSGINSKGKTIHYYFNYSNERRTVEYKFKVATELLQRKDYKNGDKLKLEPWGVSVFEEK